MRAHLVNTIQELQEDGGKAAALAAQSLRAAVAESVTERQPLLLHQQPEPVKGSVIRVRQQLHQRHHLKDTGAPRAESAVNKEKKTN